MKELYADVCHLVPDVSGIRVKNVSLSLVNYEEITSIPLVFTAMHGWLKKAVQIFTIFMSVTLFPFSQTRATCLSCVS